MPSHNKKTADHKSGEAGHEGHDRQPEQSTTFEQVASRSKEAAQLKTKTCPSPDIAHPGPTRLESEKSHGNARHDQHESEPDMQKRVEDL